MQMIQPICGTKVVLSKRTSQPAATESRWSVLVDLVQARLKFGLNDRDLAVLRGLISCLPKADVSKTFVFASNVTLSNRIDGMNERSLRRHLAKLILAGLIARHSSPNGKRYVRRTHLGDAVHSFGFDLAPLFARRAEIAQVAQDVRQEANAVARLREQLSLLRQALGPADAELADALRKLLRRNLDQQSLESLIANVSLRIRSCSATAMEMAGNDSHFVRHKQKSIKDLEGCKVGLEKNAVETKIAKHLPDPDPQVLPTLETVLEACPDIAVFAAEPVRSWLDLINFADVIAPMLQIDRSVIDAARRKMGAAGAAVAVLCILQMGAGVRSAGAYLSSLSIRATSGVFSVAKMIKAVLARQAVAGAGG